jgi:hypothetical protein
VQTILKSAAGELAMPLYVRELIVLLGFFLIMGDSAFGDVTAAGPETELAKLAATMKPGSWAELKTKGYTQELLGGHDILVYSDKAVWDPTSQQVLFVGQDHLKPPPRFIVYSAKTNSWKAMPTPPWAEKLKWFHAYENNAIDAGKGLLFHHSSASQLIHQYDIAKDAWTTMPPIAQAATGHGTALEYFPEMKGLVRVYSGTVHFYSEAQKSWTVLSKEKLPMGPYHNVAAYSAPAKAVVFGGGNSSQDIYRLDATAKITAGKKAPVGLGIGQSINWVDPITGELLVLHKEGKFFAYSPDRDDWRSVSKVGFPVMLKGSSHHVIAAPISTHGVTFLFTSPARGLKVYLYKHAAPGAAG